MRMEYFMRMEYLKMICFQYKTRYYVTLLNIQASKIIRFI